jgi:hypothetical protein
MIWTEIFRSKYDRYSFYDDFAEIQLRRESQGKEEKTTTHC